MTVDHYNALLRVYPTIDDIKNLSAEMDKTEPDDWEKGERYFYHLVKHWTIKNRLVLWQFEFEFPEKRDLVKNTLKNFDLAFEEIRSSAYFKKILGFILALGNILNGGTTKGQADGFYLEALSKVTTTKDINNRTIMQIICEKMKQEDEEFLNIKNQFKNVYWVTGYNLKEEESKLGEMKTNLNKVLAEYAIAINPEQGGKLDKYCMDRKAFLDQTAIDIA